MDSGEFAGEQMDRRKRLAHASLFGTSALVRPFRCSVVVAHPADEVIGAGGLISKLNDVTVIHLTDGAPRSKRIVHEAGFEASADYAKARRRECISALALANVSPDCVLELDIGDHQAPHFLTDLSKRLTTLLQQSAPDIVLTHPYEGGHPDHDAAAFATNAAVRLLKRHGFKPPTLFEMALHPGRDGEMRVLDFLPSSGRETTTLMLDEESQELKRRMYACFATQGESLKENPIGPEKFRRPPAYDFTLPPQRGKLNYENFDREFTGEEWQLLARKASMDLFPEEATVH
ncbi:MAG TPA: PIG-L family deacetylase [Pyrinomonadaceae bacterium]|nr:PIG-L family deacetylase [Pyrinomonadaceae bacterium]